MSRGREIEAMAAIQREKARDIDGKGAHQLDPEGEELAARKRFTLDVVTTPSDPLR